MILSSHALTTLAAVKDARRIVSDDTGYDQFLIRLINSVSEEVEGYCCRHFEKADYVERYCGSGKHELWLNHYPVVSVLSISISEQSIEPSEYEVENDEVLYRDDGWPFTGKKDISISYTAGYVLPKDENAEADLPVIRTLPYDLEDAVIDLVIARFNLRQEDADGKASRIQQDFNVRFEKGIPDHIKKILDRYRRVLV